MRPPQWWFTPFKLGVGLAEQAAWGGGAADIGGSARRRQDPGATPLRSGPFYSFWYCMRSDLDSHARSPPFGHGRHGGPGCSMAGSRPPLCPHK